MEETDASNAKDNNSVTEYGMKTTAKPSPLLIDNR
jgi:hypothetical protein